MKLFFLILVFFPFAGSTQEAILIDRSFYAPVNVVDTVIMEQVVAGSMPVLIRDIDSVLSVADRLMETIFRGGPQPDGLLDLKAGNSRWTVRMETQGWRKQYTIILNTKFGLFETYLVVASNEMGKRALQRLSIFADYLRNNVTAIVR